MLGISHDELQFQVFSKYCGFEKPDGRFYFEAMKRSANELSLSHQSKVNLQNDPLLPCHILHVGNDYTKDFEGARRAGWHAVLLDRYNEKELASEWKRRGAIVLTDLMDLCEFLGSSHCKLG
jgi:putative hydrolase of the HAD superfamily